MTLLYLLIPILVSIFVTYFSPKASPSPMPVKLFPNPSPLPCYFLSHGGPTFMYSKLGSEKSEGAATTIKNLGTRITDVLKPDYIVVVSAHWQSNELNLIEVSVPKNGQLENELIYDFYGFPKYMYKELFKTKNSLEIAGSIKELLESNGFSSNLTHRGIDHGVWVPFKVAFTNHNQLSGVPPPPSWDIEIPIIQVSLTSNATDFNTHYKLGQVLNQLRSNKLLQQSTGEQLKGMIITSGMSVHNLHDLGISMHQGGTVMSYVKPFNKLLTGTLRDYKEDRLHGLNTILSKYTNLLYDAHPSLEHFVPIVVASGVADENQEEVKELYNSAEMSLGWGIYQFGSDPKL
jgi:aromatic ring-opening dioxygenase catalytic subunit (LigB family)